MSLPMSYDDQLVPSDQIMARTEFESPCYVQAWGALSHNSGQLMSKNPLILVLRGRALLDLYLGERRQVGRPGMREGSVP